MSEIKELITVIGDTKEVKWYSIIKCCVWIEGRKKIIHLPACFLKSIGKLQDIEMDEKAYILENEDEKTFFSLLDTYYGDTRPFGWLKKEYYKRIEKMAEEAGYSINTEQKKKMALLLRSFNFFGVDNSDDNEEKSYSLIGARSKKGNGRHYENIIFDNYWDNNSPSFNCDKIGPCAPLDGTSYSWGWEMVSMFYSMLWVNYHIGNDSLKKIISWIEIIDYVESLFYNPLTVFSFETEKPEELSWEEYIIVYMYVQNKRRFWERIQDVYYSVYDKMDLNDIKNIIVSNDNLRNMKLISRKYGIFIDSNEVESIINLFKEKSKKKFSRSDKDAVYKFIFPESKLANKSMLKRIENNIHKAYAAYKFRCARNVIKSDGYSEIISDGYNGESFSYPFSVSEYSKYIDKKSVLSSLKSTMQRSMIFEMALELKLFYIAKKWNLSKEMATTSQKAKKLMLTGFNHNIDGFNNVLNQAYEKRGEWFDFAYYESAYYICTLPIRETVIMGDRTDILNYFEKEISKVGNTCKACKSALDTVLNYLKITKNTRDVNILKAVFDNMKI